MNRFLLGVLAMGAFVVLTSFALRLGSSSRRNVPGGPAWTVSQYQLDRAFRISVAPAGPSGGIGILTCQVPATGGAIITQIRPGYGTITVDVNGYSESFPPLATYDYTNLNPPIIARPNDVITITGVAGYSTVLAGYTTRPGET